jgi:hypothetical protein
MPAPYQESWQVAAARADSTIVQPEVSAKEPPLTFPVTVAECLACLRESDARTLMLKAASMRGGLLIKGEGGEFVLIEDDNTAHRQLVVPSLKRFGTKQDFYSNYDDFYDCARVTSGEVSIVRPALVFRVAEGWQLYQKGELKV